MNYFAFLYNVTSDKMKILFDFDYLISFHFFFYVYPHFLNKVTHCYWHITTNDKWQNSPLIGLASVTANLLSSVGGNVDKRRKKNEMI
jgi:hypothetical protein